MEHLIFYKEDDVLTITKDDSNLHVFTKLVKQSLQPNIFLTRLCNGHVLSFCGGQHNRSL